MPYKRTGSPFYQVRRRKLPGYGDSTILTSKVTNKKLARDMERVLEEIAHKALEDPSWYGLLDAVCREKKVELPDLLKARNMGTLESLKRSLTDPLLTDAIKAYRRAVPENHAVRVGFRTLLKYVPAGTRLGELNAKAITNLCVKAETDGRQRNSVHRTVHRCLSLLLRFHLGNAERNRIFADVHFTPVDDTREIHLTPEELRRLIASCHELGYGEMATLIRVALLTSADRGVLLSGQNLGKKLRGLLVRDVEIYHDASAGTYSGNIYLADTKTTARSRSVPITDSMCRELLVLCKGKQPDDAVFSIHYQQMDFLWKRARKRAGLEGVRFKDLRAQTAIYGEEAGIPQTVIQKTMGHGDEAMTRRYQRRQAALSQAQASAIEEAMFGEHEGSETRRIANNS